MSDDIVSLFPEPPRYFTLARELNPPTCPNGTKIVMFGDEYDIEPLSLDIATLESRGIEKLYTGEPQTHQGMRMDYEYVQRSTHARMHRHKNDPQGISEAIIRQIRESGFTNDATP